MDTVRTLLTAKATRLVTICVVLVAGAVVAVGLLRSTPTYPVNVNYASAPGLFTGAAVDVLGVKVGTVTQVRNVGDKVHVVLAVNAGTKIPAAAFASLVAPQLLGSPDVDLNPGYTGGPALTAGATIPEDHTAVPVSTDEVLKELQKTLNALNPHAVGDLVTNLATDLDGQGANLNKLIASAAGTVQLLAEKGNDLGQLNGTLAQLTGTLDGDTANIESLVQQYDTVSTTVAQHSGQLNDAITQLAGASTGLVNLLVPNLQPLEADVGTVTTAGRTLDRNLSSVDSILANGNSLFQGAARAYDPTYNWLDLNLQASPGVTSAYMAGLIRDRLAGVCRRITANHSSGLSSTVLASLAQCGDPSSSFFDPLINTIPTVLNSLTGQSGAGTEQSLVNQGLAQIAGALGSGGTTSNPSTPATPAPSARSTTPSSPTTTTTTTQPAPSATTTTNPCGLLNVILGCTSPSGSSAPSGSNASTTSSGGGLLSDEVDQSASGQPSTATATLATVSPRTGDPTLTAPAAADLGPLPQGGSHHRVDRRSLVGQWWHDATGWL
jgi:phospholipid/cholesterol/gamma-HCH transport system substrate-binding protein